MPRGMRIAVASGLAALAGWALPAAASAADVVSTYHPNAEARDFAAGNGGSTSSQEVTGLCIPVLLCPVQFNAWINHDGASGPTDGYLSSSISSLTGVAGESKAIWAGPPFDYHGAAGQEPDSLTLGISHKSNLGALLSVVGNSADYSVEIVDESSNNVATRPIDGASLAPTQGWVNPGPVAVDPSALTMDHTYRLRIISRFVYGATVLPGGGAGYDDLELIARRSSEEENKGGCADTPLSSACFDGRRLFIHLKCFGVSQHGRCFSRATALKSKKGTRYTFPIQRKLNNTKGKLVRARIRFQFRSELERRRSIILKSVLRTSRHSKDKTTNYMRLKLIKRS